jgi:uncharacterized protein (DUF1800 family)
MAVTTQLKNQHLLWRAGFGPAVEQLKDLSKYTPTEFFRALVKASVKKPEYINAADGYLEGLMMGIDEVSKRERRELTADERKKRQQKNRESIRNLNLEWMSEMVNSKAQLREKLSLFWHGHFACRNLNVFYQQGLLDILRRNALGNFGKMLKEVSRSAAMLNFLNNQQNKKGHPNENFAREVMELFTLGRGNYSENDIKEAARAFTGWSADLQGEFVFRKNQHDFGSKTVLGHTGNFDGDDVLDILLDRKETAYHICKKIYRYFVNEKIDETKVKWLADRFYKNEYEISKLLEDIFTSEWFYDQKNIGSNIKSPVELLVGIQRMIPMKMENEEALLVLQRILGQVLFYPPNVAGWSGGRSWIDSSTLMMRMRIPQLIIDEDEMNVKPKDDDDQMMGRGDAEGMQTKKGGASNFATKKQQINASLDWDLLLKDLEKTPREELVNSIASILLQVNTAPGKELLTSYADASNRESFIKTVTLRLMGTPEYQLC